MKFRCSSCGTIVDDSQVKCHGCSAVFHTERRGVSNMLGALTGNRPIDEIKGDWLYEIRRAIVGGTQKTFGIGENAQDLFKQPKEKEKLSKPKVEIETDDGEVEIIDAEFEIIEEETISPKSKVTVLEDLPDKVREALNKRMDVKTDDTDDNSE